MSASSQANPQREEITPESHPYKNVPQGKGSLSFYHQQNQTSSATVHALRADVWSPNSVTSITTPPPQTPDGEFLNQLSSEELVGKVRNLEAKNRKLLYDNGAMTRDINHHLTSLQQIKLQNNQLASENNELRDLCCFLDDERARCQSIAREWQAFGTHMSRVLRHEITNYSNKLSKLESKQFELVRENLQLKQLCMLMDNALASRDKERNQTLHSLGDSHGANSQNLISNSVFSLPKVNPPVNSSTNCQESSNAQQHRMILSHEVLEYIKSLEDRIYHYENERKQYLKSVPNSSTASNRPNEKNNFVITSDIPRPACPQPLVKAMKALKIQEQLNSVTSSNGSNHTDNSVESNTSTNEASSSSQTGIITDRQKAIINGLCNVVWRKIEETS